MATPSLHPTPQDHSSVAATAAVERYTTVAMALHWLIAVAIIGLIVSGTWMADAIKVKDTQAIAYDTYQLHKSFGLTVLVLSLARLVWRFAHPAPPLPAHMTKAERFGAAVSHTLFYVLMIGMPLIGWAMVSASPFGLPTIVFGAFEWPHISWIDTLDNKEPVEAALKWAHWTGAVMFVALLALHIGAALKHHFFDRDGVLARMVPGLKPRLKPRPTKATTVATAASQTTKRDA